MTLEQFEDAVNSLLVSVSTMTLASTSGAYPWASDVYFAANVYELIFFSSPASRHSLNLVANPNCAVTIHPSTSSWREIRGLQMEGIAEAIEGVEPTTQAILVYSEKFLFARDLLANPFELGKKALNVKAHVFRPNRIHYLDNSLGFGTRYSIRVENGQTSGSLQRDAGH
jgi:uncharacterized protein